MISLAAQAVARDTSNRWSPQTIHDTVAAIARQPEYSTSIRQSLLGRFFRFLFQQLEDLRGFLHGSPGARLIVIVAVALIVFVIVARIVVSRRLDQSAARARARGGPSGRGRADYWIEARSLASAGDHAGACHALYAAVLDALARGGAVRVHPSKTSGDYSRELARRGVPAAPAFRTFARQFERIVFGGDANVSAEDFEHLAAAAERVMPSPVAA